MTDQIENKDEKRTVNIITMNNGMEIDFKKRNNVVQSIDLDNNEVTFHVFTGETLTIDLAAIPAEIRDLVFAKGVVNILKSNLAGVKLQEENDGVVVNSLAISLQKGIDSLLSGKVSLRATSESEDTLSDEEKFFAVASTFERGSLYNPGWASAAVEVDGYWLFNDEVSSEVAQQVSTAWAGMDRKARNAVRRDGYYKRAESHAFDYLLEQTA